MVLKDIEFKIIKENWSNGTTWIYRIQPIGTSLELLKKHPIYKTYSIISNKPFIIGQVVTADLEPKSGKQGSEDYHFIREVIKFPKNPEAQWEFFDRIAGNHSFKRVYNEYLINMSPLSNVLDTIMDNIEPPLFLDEKLNDAYYRLRDTIMQYQKNAAFIEHIPSDIAELLSDSVIDKLASLSSSTESSAKMFLDQPFSAIHVEGLGFKTLDKIRGKLFEVYPKNYNYSDDNPTRVYYGAYDIIDRNMIRSGNTYLTSDDLESQMINDLRLPSDSVIQFVNSGYRSQPAINGRSVMKYDDMFTTSLIYNSERKNFEFLTKMNSVSPDPKLEIAIENYISDSGLDFADEQLEFLRSINDHKISILSGGGGTGKTWLVSKLIDIFESVYPNSTVLTAPTGKAAHVLSVYTDKNASTIHKTFNISPEKEVIHGSILGSSLLKLIVFDESSMIDTVLMANVINAIEDLENIRLVFIGDPYQLPSVGPGNILHTLLKYNVASITKLTKVFRVGNEEGGIAKLSRYSREGRFPFKSVGKAEAIGGDLVIDDIEDPVDIHDRVLTAYHRLLSKDKAFPEDIMVLSPQNKGLTGQAQLNLSIQGIVREFYNRTEDSYLGRNIFGVDTNFYPDDLIMFNNNQIFKRMNLLSQKPSHFDIVDDELEDVGVNNGDMGIIDSMDDLGMIVSLIGKNESVYISKSDLSTISLGYAFTIHKSQGSQSAYGIMAIAPKDTYSLNANLLYTGVSRFINRLYYFGSYKATRNKVKQFINLSRNTLLEKWLKEWGDSNVVF